MNPRYVRTFAAGFSVGLAGLASAVDTSYWTHATAADWVDARLDGLVVTNYGEVQLGRSLTDLARGVDGASIIFDLARAEDGTVYAASGPEGVLIRIKPGGEVERFVLPEVTNLLTLNTADDGTLIVGTGGDEGRLLRVALPDAPDGEIAIDTLFQDPAVQYIWQVADVEGGYLIGTGPEAVIFAVPADGGESQQVFQAEGETNVQSLVVDGGIAYAGTSPNGLVWRLDLNAGTGTVLFDSAEPEVTALALVNGTLYAATAAEGMTEEMEEAAGRPTVVPGGPGFGIDEMPEMELPNAVPDAPDEIPLEINPLQDSDDGQDELPDEDMEDVMEPEIEEDFPGPPEIPQFSNGLAGEGEGSAIYRIELAEDRPGLVSGVLRDGGLLYDLAYDGEALYIGASSAEMSRARIVRLNPSSGETAIVATPDAMQVTRLLPTEEGLLIGLSNSGAIARLSNEPATGTLISGVLDAGSVAQFGTIELRGRLPEGSEIQIQTRSGNTADPDDSPAGWNEWSEAQPARRFMASNAQPGRYFQYQLSFTGSAPAVERVRIAYQLPNLPPTVAAVYVEGEASGMEVADIVASATQSGQSVGSIRTVSWDAVDPNNDPLVYDVLVRRNRVGEFLLVAEGLTDSAYAWDTRATGEGLYEVQIVARDDEANPPGQGKSASRVTEPVRVDLTAPVVGNADIDMGGDVMTIKLRATDAMGIVARLEYLAGKDPADPASWRRVFPDDGIADGPDERFTFTLDFGAARAPLRVRVVDDSGNLAYTSFPLPAGNG